MSREWPPRLTESQRLFARSTYPYPAFVGGFGSGKTFAGATRLLSLLSQDRGVPMAYYMPTYSLVEDVAFPQFAEMFDGYSIRHRLLRGRAPRIELPDYNSRIIFRTYEKPDRIVGYSVGHSIVDEIDTLPTDKAKAVWDKVIARNRKNTKRINSIGVVTTPEGFRFVYDRWQREAKPGFRLYRGKTRENAKNLPANYIPMLEDNYSTNLLLAYLEGEFVNLTSGSVYPTFSRTLNASRETVRPGEPLHVGMDFNVTKMASVIYVLRNDEPHAVGEFTKVFDTPAMIKLLQDRYQEGDVKHQITVYPDASGDSRKSVDASKSDIALLKQAKFQVSVNPRNPAVKDRVLATNGMILKKDGTRRLKVNPDTCPQLVEAFEKQAYDNNGEPDKSAGFDHIIDAGTYPIAYRYPIVKSVAQVLPLRM